MRRKPAAPEPHQTFIADWKECWKKRKVTETFRSMNGKLLQMSQRAIHLLPSKFTREESLRIGGKEAQGEFRKIQMPETGSGVSTPGRRRKRRFGGE
jgi:hypothetical protein